MKKTFLIVTFLFSFTFCNAQKWLTDLDEAKKVAAIENKKIVMVFMGSDWCPPCKRLNSNILSSKEFKSHADRNYVMVKVDFPKKTPNLLSENQTAYNLELTKKYNPSRKLPRVIVMDKEAEVLGMAGYKRMKPMQYIKLLSSFSGLVFGW
ncbi:thioredoxin family protein [Aquimarina agarilytica]|uniref:thioredoxin family protein n=1 Tax=Aquimarina agarilytica TaxID=1087449 RepID=UPI0002899C65|nr:thioredoxin family protein [Aquimarina agarilytica]